MASWIDNLRRASFRGIAFHTESMAVTPAGAGPTTSIPAATCPMPRTWAARNGPGRFAGYMIGDDYAMRRDGW